MDQASALRVEMSALEDQADDGKARELGVLDLTDAVPAARVSSFSKVARRSGLQHVRVPRSLSRDNQIGRSPHTTQSRGLREFS